MKRPTPGAILRATLIFLLSTALSQAHTQDRPAASLPAAQTHTDETVIRKFFKLREQLLDERGSSSKVDELLSMFEDGGHYEHPAASVIMTLDEARSGMLAHLREGRGATITIKRIFQGSNFSIVETTLHYSMPDDSGTLKKIERNGVAIFEMKGDRIVRIAEY